MDAETFGPPHFKNPNFPTIFQSYDPSIVLTLQITTILRKTLIFYRESTKNMRVSVQFLK